MKMQINSILKHCKNQLWLNGDSRLEERKEANKQKEEIIYLMKKENRSEIKVMSLQIDTHLAKITYMYHLIISQSSLSMHQVLCIPLSLQIIGINNHFRKKIFVKIVVGFFKNLLRTIKIIF